MARFGRRQPWCTTPTAEEAAKNAKSLREARRGLHANCRHKKGGNPIRPCKRCHRAGLERYATTAMSRLVGEMRRYGA